MSFDLQKITSTSFHTDAKSDELNTKFISRLGMRWHYQPARLAIALSLADQTLPKCLEGNNPPGKTIKGDTIFGAGANLSIWLSLIIEHSQKYNIDSHTLQELVEAHWRRGLLILDKHWKESGEDISRFMHQLVLLAKLPTGYGDRPQGLLDYATSSSFAASEGTIQVSIGTDIVQQQEISWNLNGAGGSPHCAIMGGVGSGKTRTAASMLKSIHDQASQVPLIAFDFKGDLEGYELDQLFDAQTLEPPRQSIPLDVLALKNNDDITISETAIRFRESFAHLKGSKIGEQQKNAIREAANQALKHHSPCELSHIQAALQEHYEQNEKKEDGAISAMKELCLFPLFKPEQSPADFFSKSWIIKLPPNVTENNRTIVVNLLLDALDQYLNSLSDAPQEEDGSRKLRVICMVDEAHRILGTKLRSLSNLVRMSRSKGGAIMLISQSPDDFSTAEDDFLSEMGLVMAFSTNAFSKNVKHILGQNANLTGLQKGQCLVKLRDTPTSKKVVAWTP